MTTLPSFVELMASLGLDSQPTTDVSRQSHSRSPSSSTPSKSPRYPTELVSPYTSMPPMRSPSITVSRAYPSSPAANADPEQSSVGIRQRARYSPYSPRISHTRMRSLPSVRADGVAHGQRNRSLSISPRTAQAAVAGARSERHSSRRPTVSGAESMADTPISSFVRRKSPHASPTSPNFRHRRTPSADPLPPLSLPSLPPLLSAPPTSESRPRSETSRSMLSDFPSPGHAHSRFPGASFGVQGDHRMHVSPIG